jgi:plasmid maintenance system antidote protein VapI
MILVSSHDHAATAEPAVKFGAVLETSPELWMNAQRGVDIWDAQLSLKKWKPAAIYTGEKLST